MVAVASPSKSFQPVICEKCGEAQVAPDHAEYFGEEALVLYLWSCRNCGNRFETELPAEVGPEAERKAVKAFWPSLLVG
jgi:hypothetical protein